LKSEEEVAYDREMAKEAMLAQVEA